MNRKRLIAWVSALMLAFGWVTSAQADEAPALVKDLGPVGAVFTMCDAETTETAVCAATSGDQIVLDTGGFKSIVVDFSESTASTIDCDVVGNNVGHDATTGTGETMNTTAFSTTLLADEFTDPPRFVWVYCTTITAGNITATILGRR